MLITLLCFILKLLAENFVFLFSALLEPVMVIVITIAGIVIMLGAVGLKISNNLGSTVVNGLFRAIGYLGRTVIQSIGWIIRNTFKLLPNVFKRSRNFFVNHGINPTVSTLLAVIIVILII